MSSKQIKIYFNQKNLDFIHVIAGSPEDENPLNMSTAANMAIQIATLFAFKKLPITSGELLYCCDILNPGPMLTEFSDHETINVLGALQSMRFSIVDGLEIYPQMAEKWSFNIDDFYQKIQNMDLQDFLSLAVATKLFWSKKSYGDLKPLSTCADYAQWASQFIE